MTRQIVALRKIMADNALSYRDVAELCSVSPKTVESWLADPASAMYRNMPYRHLMVIGFALPGFLGKRRTAAKTAKG